MRFELRPGFVTFHDVHSGSHATMFGPDGKKFLFRGDLSFFDDAKGVYAWCFEGEIWDGNKIVFATSDRQIEGMVIDGKVVIQSAEPVVVVSRGIAGKPLSDGTPGTVASPAVVASVAEKESQAAAAVASKAMEPPHPRMRPRPIPMPRLK